MGERSLPRLEVLELIRDAGRRNDRPAYETLYAYNRVGKTSAEDAWTQGRADALRNEAEESGRAA